MTGTVKKELLSRKLSVPKRKENSFANWAGEEGRKRDVFLPAVLDTGEGAVPGQEGGEEAEEAARLLEALGGGLVAEVGETLRHGQVPDVRVVGGQHWLLAPGFEPDTDFYSDRHGRKFVPATSLTWAFSGNEPCFIEPRGRPDYRLELPA